MYDRCCMLQLPTVEGEALERYQSGAEQLQIAATNWKTQLTLQSRNSQQLKHYLHLKVCE